MGQDKRTTLQYVLIFAFEAAGTSILLIANNFSQNFYVYWGGVFLAIMFSGKISGAHFHAGLTIGRYIIDGDYRNNLKHLVVMITAQFIGGYLGEYYSYLELEDDISFIKPPSSDTSMWFVLISEIFFTFLMITAIMITMYSQTNLSKDMFINAVGGCIAIYFCLNACQPLSGPALNPTLGFINSSFNAIVKDTTYFKYSICYFFGPIIGSIIGGFYIKYVMITFTP